MGKKFSCVHDLVVAHGKQIKKVPAKGVYATAQRRKEVQNAHARKVIRSKKRSVGKSNKLGCRRSAEGMAYVIAEANFSAMICRQNRQSQAAKLTTTSGTVSEGE